MVEKAMTVKRDKVGPVFWRIDADALVEVERCLAVFLGIAK
jgi:mRNA interferase MazF